MNDIGLHNVDKFCHNSCLLLLGESHDISIIVMLT